MKNRFRKLLPKYLVQKVVLIGTKRSLKFEVKDRTIFSHNHDIISHGNCSENGCPDKCVEETSRRILEWVLERTGNDFNGHLYKQSIKTGHQTLEISDYRTIGNGYGNNWNKRKIAEALLIK